MIVSSRQHLVLRLKPVSKSTNRCITTNGQKKLHELVCYEDAAPFREIPTINFLQLFMRGMRDKNLQESRNHIFLRDILREKSSSIVHLRTPGKPPMLIISDPIDVKTLLDGDGKYPIASEFNFFNTYRQQMRKDLFPGTAGLLGSHGEKWYKDRSLVQQDMLRPMSALYYIQEVSSVTDDFLKLVDREMRDGRVADIAPLLYKWSFEAVGAIFLNTRIGCLDEKAPRVANDMIECVRVALGESMLKLNGGVPLWKFFKTKNYKDFDEASEGMYRITDSLIKYSMSKLDGSSDKEKSVLEKLIDKCGKDSDIPTVMAMDALMAGIDTTGNTSAFFFYHLASNPEKQEILFQEVKKEVGDRRITPEIINKLKYLKAAQRESQRLMPAVEGVARETQKDLVLAGYQIPSGCHVTAAMTSVMRSELHFNQPTEFIPERFLRGSPQQHGAHPFAFLPFGHGARMCIGRRFAELKVQIVAIQTLRRFKLEYEGDPQEMVTLFVNRPDGPIKIKFTPRD